MFSFLHSSYVQNNGLLITILYYINSPFPNSLPEGKFPNFSFSVSSFTIFYLFQVIFSTFKTVPHLIFAFLHFSHHLNIRIPYSRTNSSLYSFFPNTSALWNSLPTSVKDSNSPTVLRNSLRHLFK